MYDTSGSYSVCATPPIVDRDLRARLNWLEDANALEDARRRKTPRRREREDRRAREEEQALAFERPVSTQEAFARFGALMGLLPPAAIFGRALWAIVETDAFMWLVLPALVMNLICCAVGRAMAVKLASTVDNVERRSWAWTLIMPALLGMLWGLVSGAAGGFLFFGFGAIFGVLCAVPVGALGFALFTPLHRLLARGGMIEGRQLWPLACGVNGLIAALILSPHVFPY